MTTKKDGIVLSNLYLEIEKLAGSQVGAQTAHGWRGWNSPPQRLFSSQNQ
jgi:hypothetical protein